jgi:Holliday junction resolvasome RuvABC endonuclease subunit
MTKAIGIDPGNSGCFAVFIKGIGLVELNDMPTMKVVMGAKKTVRTRVDVVGVRDLLARLAEYAPDIVALEDVGARKAQSGMFTFGRTQGIIEMGIAERRMFCVLAQPRIWKKDMKCPVEGDGIVQLADRTFPGWTASFRGPRGAFLHDRAEAALLAKWAADRYESVVSAPDALKTPVYGEDNGS